MGGTLDFSSIATVSELAAAGERMVCLLFPEVLGALYCHSFLLSFYSSVLRNVLEDTPQQEQLFTIPLSGDSDVSLWNLALGVIYHQDTATITLDNAQALLLLAHKYDMRYITSVVDRFLMSKDVSAADSRFNSHLSPSTVSSWLVAASKSGLEQQVQLCIDYIVSRDQPLEMDLASLAPAHANQLLTAMQHKLADYRKSYTEASCKLISAQGEAKIELYTASRSVERLDRELSQKNDEILAANKLKDAIVKHLVPYSKASSSPLTAYTCSMCRKRWVGDSSCRINCCRGLKDIYRDPVAVPLPM